MKLANLKVLAAVRIGMLAVIYAVVLFLSRWLAYQVRFEFELSLPDNKQFNEQHFCIGSGFWLSNCRCCSRWASSPAC